MLQGDLSIIWYWCFQKYSKYNDFSFSHTVAAVRAIWTMDFVLPSVWLFVKLWPCIASKALSQDQTISLHNDEEQTLFGVEKLLHELVPVLIVFTFCSCFFQNLWGAGRLEARNCQNRILGEITFIFILFSSVKSCIGWATSRQAACLASACAVLAQRIECASCFRVVRLTLFTTKCSSKLK